MMNRIKDASIPLFCFIATVPVFWRITDLPVSMEQSLGQAAGILWCVVVGTAMLAICLGVVLRKSKPGLAYSLEYPALIVAGMISAIYGVAIFGAVGIGKGWTPSWFVWAIGAHCTARFVEFALARRAAKRESQ